MFLRKIKTLPLVGPLVKRIHNQYLLRKRSKNFKSSTQFWTEKYVQGGHSGFGSYNELAEFKADVINELIKQNNFSTFVEFGSGDGNQVKLIDYPNYVGYDISEVAVEMCREHFKGQDNRDFRLMSDYGSEKFDVSISLDVIFHLVEDDVYQSYLKTLFGAAEKAVIIYSSNNEENTDNYYPQVRHRKFTADVEAMFPDFFLETHIPNKYPYKGNSLTGSFADFYIYKRK
ncbi:methyltransferase domain-containing protein [Ekhidna sp.]|uniref:methyltransferase domain-containing protein n=1 Tax=Ekhidna sp. TaxID=2608089 RepID=UPI0035155512